MQQALRMADSALAAVGLRGPGGISASIRPPLQRINSSGLRPTLEMAETDGKSTMPGV
jgi:hypothetical protein